MRAFQHIAIVAALLCAVPALAQQSADSTAVGNDNSDFVSSFNCHAAMYDKEFMPVELGFEVGWKLTRWLAAGLRFEEAIAMSEVDGEHRYAKNETLGLVAWADLARYDNCVLMAKVMGGAALGSKHNDWQYIYYDANAGFRLDYGRLAAGMSIGVRYYDSRSDFLGNKVKAYCELGFVYGL